MVSQKTNALIDILMGISFIISAISGLVLIFILPKGSGRAENVFFGLLRENWIFWHGIISLLLIFLVIIHLVFHWKWILCIPNFFKKDNKKK